MASLPTPGLAIYVEGYERHCFVPTSPQLSSLLRASLGSAAVPPTLLANGSSYKLTEVVVTGLGLPLSAIVNGGRLPSAFHSLAAITKAAAGQKSAPVHFYSYSPTSDSLKLLWKLSPEAVAGLQEGLLAATTNVLLAARLQELGPLDVAGAARVLQLPTHGIEGVAPIGKEGEGSAPFSVTSSPRTVYSRCSARVGLLGNPSDGYKGKTLSVPIAGYAAEAWLTERSDGKTVLQPHPLYDPLQFSSMQQLAAQIQHDGYAGGVRLMQATFKRFYLRCRERGLDKRLLEGAPGCTACYSTNIPRQVGLAGSSAIVTALVHALLDFYGLTTQEQRAELGLDRDRLPSFVLAIETEELGITAGLQDRVVQSYGCCVHMDFSCEQQMKEKGHGSYTPLPLSSLPPLFLAYASEPSDSGKIHAPVRQRWLAGEKEVVEAMSSIAELADKGRQLCESKPYAGASSAAAAGAAAEAGAGAASSEPWRAAEAVAHEWASLLKRNISLRRQLFSDAALGRQNLQMIGLAEAAGAAAKFPGSGGAVLGLLDVQGMEEAGTLQPLLEKALAAWKEEEAAREGKAGAAESADMGLLRLQCAEAVLRQAYAAEGFVFERLQPTEASH